QMCGVAGRRQHGDNVEPIVAAGGPRQRLCDDAGFGETVTLEAAPEDVETHLWKRGAIRREADEAAFPHVVDVDGPICADTDRARPELHLSRPAALPPQRSHVAALGVEDLNVMVAAVEDVEVALRADGDRVSPDPEECLRPSVRPAEPEDRREGPVEGYIRAAAQHDRDARRVAALDDRTGR